MTVSASTRSDSQAILAASQYHKGSVSPVGLMAMLQAYTERTAATTLPPIRTITCTAVVSTAMQVVISGACRLYGMRIENEAATAAFVVLDNALTGGNLKLVSAYVAAGASTTPAVTEAYYFGSGTSGAGFGIGIPFSTGIGARAYLASDGTTTADAGCTVTFYYGV